MLFLEYQVDDIEKGLVFIYMALMGPFFRSKWRIFCAKPLSKTCENRVKTTGKIPLLFSFPAITTLRCVRVFCPLWRMASPRNKLFIVVRRPYQSPRGILVLKRTEVIAAREIYQGSLLVILVCFSRFLEGNFLENPFQNLNGVINFSLGKFHK